MRLVAAGIAMAACSPTTAAHGPPWIDGPSLPTARSSAGVAAIGDTVVVIGGEAGGAAIAEADALDGAMVFAGSNTTWMPLPALPQPGSELQVAAVGTRIFVLGGFDATGAGFGDVYVLDTSAAGSALAWTPVTALPTPRGGAAVATIPPKIYLFGGATATTGTALASVTSYDTQGDFWCPDPTDVEACPPDADLPDMPAARTEAAAIVQNDGGTFVVAGGAPAPAAAPAGDVWWLPPSLTSGPPVWITKTSMPSPRADCAYGAIGGRLVCAGGQVACAGTPAICAAGNSFSYEPALDGIPPMQPWCRLADLLEPLVGGHGAVIGARLFVAGGAAMPGGSATDAVSVYSSGDDPATDPIPDTEHDPMLCPQ